MQPTRRAVVGRGEVQVFDGFFSADEIASVYTFLRSLPYRLNDADTPETSYSRHWKAELPLNLVNGTSLLRRCVELASGVLSIDPGALGRVHANLHMYGDMQFPHTDLPGGVTALYYANPHWEEGWLGETVFYDEQREPLHTVAPKPGRVALFDADILHRAGVPSRECFEPRISVAFKFKR